MDYEKTKIKPSNGQTVAKKINQIELNRISTTAIIWHIVKRHKMALVTTYAITLTALWAVPSLPSMLLGIIN